MLRPIGPEPAAVYWRRRLVVFAAVAALVVLVVLTFNAVRSGSGAPAAANETTGRINSAPRPSTSGPSNQASGSTSTTSTTSGASSGAKPGSTSGSSASGSGSASGSTSTSAPPPADCVAQNLKVSAVVGKTTYRVTDKPLLELQVLNIGAKPCVQDLADKQVELRVYNGESRIWGSHDCQIQPGTTLRTLASNVPVRVAINWSGLTSQPGANGCTPSNRQRVGVGTYTLYASLAGRTGTAAQFTVG